MEAHKAGSDHLHRLPKQSNRATVKKHISTACTLCRTRKVKCDGQTPTCSNCMLYEQRCEYNHSDKRKLSHKKTIQSLTSRVELLESLLVKHGIEVPPSESQPSTLESRHDSGDNDRANEDATVDHVLSELENATQPTKFTQPHLGMDELDIFQLDETDLTDLFQSPAAPWQPVYDFNPTNNGGQSITKTPRQATLPGSSIFQTESNTHTDYGVPLDESSIQLPPAQVDNQILSVLDSMFPSLDSMQQNNSAISRQVEGPRPATSISSRSFCEEQNLQTGDDEIMDQLSARMGAFQIAEDGQLRYFGATSNLHILQNGLSSLSPALDLSVLRARGQEVLSRAGFEQIVDQDLERHLENLYFRWEDPAIHVVDEEMYFLAKNAYYSEQERSSFYSETLKNAICAAGSSLTSRTAPGLPNDAAAFFTSRAKLLLDIEMDSPSIATVQALVIMSATEAAFTRDARGWLYSGMAVRLSADLGLHLDLSSDIQDGTVSDRELDVRRTTFWGVFIHDNMWSIYVGRPWGMNIQEISVSRPPKEMDKLRQKKWTLSADSNESLLDMQQDLPELYDPIYTCTDANVSLCAMMRQLSQTVYSDKTISDDRLREFAASMRIELDAWYAGLPNELRIDLENENRVYLPHILQLHMQFYAISILLHRPFFSQSFKQPEHHSQNGSDHPRSICISAAQSIVKILRIYRKQHTLRRTNVQIVHLVFTASLICIYNAYSSKMAAGGNSVQDLQFCCQALGEIGEAYQNSTRALEVIICIKREWFSKMQNLSRFKKRNPNIKDPDMNEIRRKRRLTQGQDEVPHVSSGMVETRSHSDGTAHGVDQNPQQFDAWQLPLGDIGRRASPQSLLDDFYPRGRTTSSMTGLGDGRFQDFF